MNKSNVLMLSITLVALFVIITFTITYSFFTPRYLTDRSTSSIDLTSGSMYVNFEDNNPNVSFSNVIPGPTNSLDDAILVKTFTITGKNNTNLKMEYNLNFKIVSNSFDDNDIGFILMGNSKNNGSYVTSAKTTFLSSSIVKVQKNSNVTYNLGSGSFEYSINTVSHQYGLYLFYIETGIAQNSQNAKFSGYIELTV